MNISIRSFIHPLRPSVAPVTPTVCPRWLREDFVNSKRKRKIETNPRARRKKPENVLAAACGVTPPVICGLRPGCK